MHQDYDFLKHIGKFIKKTKNIDLILIAGDFTHSGNKSDEYTNELLGELDLTGIRYLSVTGNADSYSTLNLLEEKKALIENKTIEYKNEIISGFSPNHEKPLENDFSIKNAIVISHIPIKKPLLDLPDAPKIWISGHWHHFFITNSFNTLFIHLPAANMQKITLIDTETKSVKLLEVN